MLIIKSEEDMDKFSNYGLQNDLKDSWNYWDGVRKIIVYKKDRRLSFNGFNNTMLDIVYDMIQDGIIEKVPWTPYKQLTNAERIVELECRIRQLEKELEEVKK